MSYSTLIVEQRNNLLIIKLDRVEQMNSLNNQLLEELNSVLDEAQKNDAIRVIIITGSESHFCAGADLKEVNKIERPMDAHAFLRMAQTTFQKLENINKPVIAAVTGYAIGGGFELMLACDLVVSSEDAKFGVPEIRAGVLPGGGGMVRLPKLVGPFKAKELVYTGKLISATEAKELCLICQITPPEETLKEAISMANNIAELSPIAIGLAKEVINNSLDNNINAGLQMEAKAGSTLFSTEDKKEGVSAFVEKRKPVFKGR